MRRSEMIMQVKFDVLEVFAAAAVYYLVLTTLWDRVQRRLEHRFDPVDGKSAAKAIAPAIEQAALPR
jgi:polar amino acid transport system permease protein